MQWKIRNCCIEIQQIQTKKMKKKTNWLKLIGFRMLKNLVH